MIDKVLFNNIALSKRYCSYFSTKAILKIIFIGLILTTNGYSLDDKASNRGKELFLNYCNGCHNLKYTSYPKVSMPPLEAKRWFGVVPPDLSLVAKIRGDKWLRKYLVGFYSDSSRPFGMNNQVFHDVQMPNALEALQSKVTMANQEDFIMAVDDIVVFLTDIAEPNQELRHNIGFGVIVFLIVFLLLSIYALKLHRK